MDADAPGCVPSGVTGLRLVADPGARAEVVEVAGRELEVDGLLDLTGVVRSDRGAVQRLARCPRAQAGLVRDSQQLLDLDDDVVVRSQTDSTYRDRDSRALLRSHRDARLRPVTPSAVALAT